MDGYFSTRRIEALTDGVFAIAMTLLVLDLKVSALGDITSSGQLWNALMAMQGSLTSFMISFLLLGSMWAVHMRQFEYLKRADRHFTMINTVRLLVVVLIPLTTSIASDYPDIVLGRILFPLNFLILAAVSYWQWNYAVSKRKLYDELPAGLRQYSELRNQAILLTSVIVLVLSVWVGQLAFLLFMLTPVVIKHLKRV